MFPPPPPGLRLPCSVPPQVRASSASSVLPDFSQQFPPSGSYEASGEWPRAIAGAQIYNINLGHRVCHERTNERGKRPTSTCNLLPPAFRNTAGLPAQPLKLQQIACCALILSVAPVRPFPAQLFDALRCFPTLHMHPPPFPPGKMHVLWVLLEAIAGRGERCVVVSTSTATLDLVERMVCRRQGWAPGPGGWRNGGLWRNGGRHGTQLQKFVVWKVIQVAGMGVPVSREWRAGVGGKHVTWPMGTGCGQPVRVVEQPRVLVTRCRSDASLPRPVPRLGTVRIDGGTSVDERQQVVDNFNKLGMGQVGGNGGPGRTKHCGGEGIRVKSGEGI